MRWFPDGHARPDPERPGTDLFWLSCIIAKSGFDVLALQEIKQGPSGRRALEDVLDELERRTGVRYAARLDECPEDGRQHVGFLWNSARVSLDEFRQVDDVNPHGGCRGRLRPGLEARARVARRRPLHLLTVHLDSGRTERDFANRQRSVLRVRAWIDAATARGESALALGDFNTMGCDHCDLPQDGMSEIEALDDALPGRLRLSDDAACSEYYRGHAGLLDHAIFVSGGALHARVAALGPCETRHCGRARAAEPYLERVSDHCPLLVTLSPAAAPHP